MRAMDDSTVGTIALAGKEVRRLGFGAMRVSAARNAEGKRDREEAAKIYRTVYDGGVNFIDVANIYGYGECEEILAEALHPYPDDLLIGTKAGFKPGKIEPGKSSLPPLGTPEHIKEECELSLRRLRLEAIDLYQVHTPDPNVPFEDTVGAFAELQQEGKVRHIGVSNVSAEQLALAQSLCEVVSVQNAYNLSNRRSDDLMRSCESQGIAFIPYSPNILGPGASFGSQGTAAEREPTAAEALVAEIGAAHGVSSQQVAVAWLLARSPVMVPIPGTSKVSHAADNVETAFLELTADELARLDSFGS
jgi:pyridoxine 4-dehydrogenase